MSRFAEWHTDLSKNRNRTLIKEGRLHRQAKFKSVDRLVYLFNDAFLVTDEVSKGPEAGRLIQKQLLDLRAIVVEDPVEKAAASGKKLSGASALSFSILTPQRDFTFIAPNAAVKADWMRLIRDTASQHKLTNTGSIVEEGAVQGKVYGLAGEEGYEGRLLTATLHSAVSDGQDDIVLHLLSERNDDPNQKSPDGKTAVHLAIEHENAFALSLLIAHGADLSLVDGDGNAPLHIACQHCDFGTVMVLLSKGADVLAVDGDGKTPLWLLCENVSDTADGADGGAEDASTKAVVDMVRMFVDAGASVDEQWQGQSLLFHLCTKGKWQSVAALCACNVNVSQVDSLSRTPLHLIALLSTVSTAAPLLTSYLRIARLLLSHGAAPNCRDGTFHTPLHLTTSQGLAGCLLVNGARADLKNEQQKKATEWFELKAHFASEADWLQAKDSLRDAQTAWVERSETVLEEGGELCDDELWTADDAIPQCVLCGLEFTLTRRRHHCRRCGSCIEAQCCTKTFRCISTQPGKMGQEVSERCCDCCYNIMCEKAVEEGKRRREEKRKEAEKARQMAAIAATKDKEANATRDTDDTARRIRESEERIKAITERTASKQSAFEEKKQRDRERERAELKGDLKATMTGNRAMLEERGQKLNEMGDKSSELMDQAANFAEMAKKLKNQEKAKSSWFGF